VSLINDTLSCHSSGACALGTTPRYAVHQQEARSAAGRAWYDPTSDDPNWKSGPRDNECRLLEADPSRLWTIDTGLISRNWPLSGPQNVPRWRRQMWASCTDFLEPITLNVIPGGTMENNKNTSGRTRRLTACR